MYHPSKPRKIRVVFDYSAQFAGKSLNQELLTDPDLTNPIVGVLTRFRQHGVTFMADIESMYYQASISAIIHQVIMVGKSQHRGGAFRFCNLCPCIWWRIVS